MLWFSDVECLSNHLHQLRQSILVEVVTSTKCVDEVVTSARIIVEVTTSAKSVTSAGHIQS